MNKKSSVITLGPINLSSESDKTLPPDYEDLPLLATRNFVLFPNVTFPILLTREISRKVCEEAESRDFHIAVVCQKDPDLQTVPGFKDIFRYGVVARVIKVFELPDGNKTAIVSAESRISIAGEGPGEHIPGVPSVKAKPVQDTLPRPTDKEFGMIMTLLRETTLRILNAQSEGDHEVAFNINDIHDPQMLINMVATHAPFSPEVKLGLLKKNRLKDRANQLLADLAKSEKLIDLKNDIIRRTQAS
ncbi:MAG: LON peptidase substrate-binding domain-containing protein, partial [Duncaniella sp.]|nr:LON peptidase substrate-binding domain-containing protein [Duncaniella sp.]